MVLQFSVECFFVRHLPHRFVYLFLQLAHAALTGVVLNDFFQSLLRERNLRLDILQSVVGEFFRYEMMLCNLHLLLGDISAEFNDFHSVEQRPRNGVEVVGRGDEHHVREVVVDVEVVVVEGIVLLRVEDLEEC